VRGARRTRSSAQRKPTHYISNTKKKKNLRRHPQKLQEHRRPTGKQKVRGHFKSTQADQQSLIRETTKKKKRNTSSKLIVGKPAETVIERKTKKRKKEKEPFRPRYPHTSPAPSKGGEEVRMGCGDRTGDSARLRGEGDGKIKKKIRGSRNKLCKDLLGEGWGSLGGGGWRLEIWKGGAMVSLRLGRVGVDRCPDPYSTRVAVGREAKTDFTSGDKMENRRWGGGDKRGGLYFRAGCSS